MANTRIAVFRTPVVHELTAGEYREQRRRVIASLVRIDPRALSAAATHARS
jgi:hypothetical protein